MIFVIKTRRKLVDFDKVLLNEGQKVLLDKKEEILITFKHPAHLPG